MYYKEIKVTENNKMWNVSFTGKIGLLGVLSKMSLNSGTLLLTQILVNNPGYPAKAQIPQRLSVVRYMKVCVCFCLNLPSVMFFSHRLLRRWTVISLPPPPSPLAFRGRVSTLHSFRGLSTTAPSLEWAEWQWTTRTSRCWSSPQMPTTLPQG